MLRAPSPDDLRWIRAFLVNFRFPLKYGEYGAAGEIKFTVNQWSNGKAGPRHYNMSMGFEVNGEVINWPPNLSSLMFDASSEEVVAESVPNEGLVFFNVPTEQWVRLEITKEK